VRSARTTWPLRGSPCSVTALSSRITHECHYGQGPGGVANLHVETAIDEASGKLTMLYQARRAPP
jgi:hypothetical protein